MRWVKSLVIGLPFVVIIVLVCLVALPYCASCGGHGEAVTAIVKRCKRATDLLGDDVHAARLGCACGSTEISGGNGAASWSVAYTGSKDRGTVSYDAIKRGGEWTVDRATLEVGDEEIDLIACAAGGGAAGKPPQGRLSQTNADAATAKFDGKVIRSTHPTLAVGSACTGELARERGSPTAHVRVSCSAGAEATVVYDGRGTFTLDVKNASRPDDDRVEYDDSAAAETKCRLSAADGKGTLTLWAAGWELVVEL